MSRPPRSLHAHPLPHPISRSPDRCVRGIHTCGNRRRAAGSRLVGARLLDLAVARGAVQHHRQGRYDDRPDHGCVRSLPLSCAGLWPQRLATEPQGQHVRRPGRDHRRGRHRDHAQARRIGHDDLRRLRRAEPRRRQAPGVRRGELAAARGRHHRAVRVAGERALVLLVWGPVLRDALPHGHARGQRRWRPGGDPPRSRVRSLGRPGDQRRRVDASADRRSSPQLASSGPAGHSFGVRERAHRSHGAPVRGPTSHRRVHRAVPRPDPHGRTLRLDKDAPVAVGEHRTSPPGPRGREQHGHARRAEPGPRPPDRRWQHGDTRRTAVRRRRPGLRGPVVVAGGTRRGGRWVRGPPR